MTTVQAWMIDPKINHEHPNESGCNDSMQCVGCGGRLQRELISEPFENDAQVYLVWRSGYRCCTCGKLDEPGQAMTWGTFGERDSDRRKAMVMPPGTRPGRSGR